MEGLLTLLMLCAVMAAMSFLAGSLPLSFNLSPSQLRFISSLGMGVLVGTSLIIIIPEGVETLYSSGNHGSDKLIHHRSSYVEWPSQGTHAVLPRGIPSTTMDLNGLPGPDIGYTPRTTPTEPEIVHTADSGESKPREEESNIDSQEDEKNENSLHAWIGIALISGFILMYLIDKLPAYAVPSKQTRQPYHISLENLGSGLRRHSSPSHDSGLLEASGRSSNKLHSFATTAGLVIHATADGIALGASGSNTGLSFIIFLALLVHKAPAAFGLTSVLLKQGLSSRIARAHLLVFSLAAPVGALLTYILVQTIGSGFGGDDSATRWRTGVLLLFSAGTFLYVAMHTMQEGDQFPRQSSNESYGNGYSESRDNRQHPKSSLRDIMVSIVGMLLPLFLQIGHAH